MHFTVTKLYVQRAGAWHLWLCESKTWIIKFWIFGALFRSPTEQCSRLVTTYIFISVLRTTIKFSISFMTMYLICTALLNHH